MKKIVTLLVFSCALLFVPAKVQAQMAVTDPALTAVTEANWTTQLEQAVQSFNEMVNQSNLMTQTIERYKKVKNLIRNGQQIVDITDSQIRIIGLISESVSEAKDNVTNVRAYEAYVARMKNLTNVSYNNVKRLNNILTDSALELSDYERMQMIDKLESDTKALERAVKQDRKKYNDLNKTLREIQRLTGADADTSK